MLFKIAARPYAISMTFRVPPFIDICFPATVPKNSSLYSSFKPNRLKNIWTSVLLGINANLALENSSTLAVEIYELKSNLADMNGTRIPSR